MNGWRESTLGEEIELAYGKALAAHTREAGDFNVFGSNGIVGTHAVACVDGPGIVIGRKGSVGEVRYSKAAFWPIDTTYFVVNKERHDWRFLYHLLKHADLTTQNSHSAVPGLNREHAYSVAVRLPPRAVEPDISKVLDFLERVLLLEDSAIGNAKALKAASMGELFSRGLRGEEQKETEVGLIPEGWEIEPLVAHFAVCSGGTPSRASPQYWEAGEVPWVKTTEVDYCVIRDTEEKINALGLAESAAKLLPAGTVLMAMYGQGVTRGKVAMLGIEAACNQACAAMTARNEVIDNKYLYHFMTWRYEAIRQLAHGGQQQNLNLDIVRALPVAYPVDAEEQRRVCAVLDAVDAKIALHQQKRAVLEELFKALLHKLMTGEIDVNDLDLNALQPDT
jgi:type I restriction enzyme S subunit